MTHRNAQILIVDDEAPIMNLCSRVLHDAGYRVTGLTKGEEALARLATTPFELLLVDYKMPGIDGFEVMRRARQLCSSLKVVLMTGHGTRKVMDEAAQQSLDGMIVKPFTPDELSRVVSRALGLEK